MVHSFRAFDPTHRAGPVSTQQSQSVHRRLAQLRRTEIVQQSRRRVISVSVFVLLLEFNRHRSKAIRILAGRRVTRFAI